MFLQGGHYEPGLFYGKTEENKPLAVFHPPICYFYLVSLNLRDWPDFSAKW